MAARNIELKARLHDPEAARRIAQSIATRYVGVEEQVDTYFHCTKGRLKLREINRQSAQLIQYVRSNQTEPKPSDYQLVPVVEPELLKQALTAALGVRAVVRKRREIFLVDNVRIHLDAVDPLGDFLEFEAVLGSEVTDAAGHAQLEDLAARFHLQPQDLLACSYGELIQQE